MIDNLEPETITQVNTSFISERTPIVEQAKHDVAMSIPRQIEQQMPDATWFAKQQLMKPVLVNQIPWTTASARGSSLYTFDFPEILINKESLMTRTLRMYAYFRLTPVVKVQINATQFHQGQLIVSFDPFAMATDPSDTVVGSDYACNIFYATGLPNVKVMASEADPVELHIPFVHPRNYLTTNSGTGYDELGRVRIMVLNPLLAAEGASSSLTVSVWIYAKDASVHVPMNYHEAVIPSGILENVGNEFTSGFPNIRGGVSQVGNAIGNIYTGNFGGALRNAQGLIDNLGNILDFDYPTRPINPDKTISPVENLAITKGASRSQRLAIDPMSSYSPSPEVFGSSTEDVDLLRIVKTPMLMAQFRWNQTDSAGTEKFKIAISPIVAPVTYDSSPGVAAGVSLHYLSFVSHLFAYWRGGITYDIEFIATHYHSGRLLAAFVPNQDETSLTYVNAASSLPNAILDIQQTSKISITIPFVSSTPVKYTRDARIDDSQIGYFALYVQNQLAMSNNVAPSIEVNVYVRAADDYQLFVPRNPCLTFSRPTPPSIEAVASGGSAVELQSNRTQDTGKATDAQLTLGSAFALPEMRFGENYSLLDLTRRFTSFGSSTIQPFTNPDAYSGGPGLFTTVRPSSGEGDVFPSYLAILTRIFSIWTGSLRFKILYSAPRNSTVSVTYVHVPDDGSDPNPADTLEPFEGFDGYAGTTTNLSQDNALEFECPYYSPYQCLLAHYPKYTSLTDSKHMPNYNGTLYVYFLGSLPTGELLYENGYIAGGDDFRLGYLRPPGDNYNTNGFGQYHRYTL